MDRPLGHRAQRQRAIDLRWLDRLRPIEVADPRAAAVGSTQTADLPGLELAGSSPETSSRSCWKCSTTPLAYIPEHVVAINHDAVAWWTPAAIRRMYFRAAPDVAVNAFDGAQLAQPPLVFVARRRMLRVFALMSNERPTHDTMLAYARYFNVNEAGHVCLGSMHLPKSMNPDDTEKWTHAFFASEFTHFSGTIKRWAHTATYAELLADLSREGTFQAQWLKGTNLTLNDVISSR